MKITGIMFYYYFVCHRKLWYFNKGISLEDESENVILGRLLDSSSYSEENKHIMVDDTINIDFIKEWKILHEIKKSRSIEEASIWQVKYYLYFLKQRGIKIEKGILDYPKLRQRKEIILKDEDVLQIKKVLLEIEQILKKYQAPELLNSKICKKCAYYEYCYV